jgi:hypothetical protein
MKKSIIGPIKAHPDFNSTLLWTFINFTKKRFIKGIKTQAIVNS